MNLLITGGAGFIGSHVVDDLARQGHRVVVIDSRPMPWKHCPEKTESVCCIEGNISDGTLLQMIVKKHEISCIVHCAAIAGIQPSVEGPLDCMNTNVVGTLSVLEAARTRDCRVVFASSSSVYGGSKRACVETDPLWPRSPYAASKVAAEAYCHAYARCYGLEVQILRFFSVYGPRQRPDLVVAKWLADWPQISIFGDGTSARDLTYVLDVAKAVVLATQAPMTRKCNVLNIGSDLPVTLLELIAALSHALGTEAEVTRYQREEWDGYWTHANNTAAWESLGWTPSTSLSEGILAQICSI